MGISDDGDVAAFDGSAELVGLLLILGPGKRTGLMGKFL